MQRGKLDAQPDDSSLPPGPQLLCMLAAAINTSLMGTLQPGPRVRKHYGRCAIISSAGVLLHHQYGDEIDKADMVLRFNTAPTATFEKFVGSTTNFRVVNDLFPGAVDYGEIEMNDSTAYITIPADKLNETEALHDKYPRSEMYTVKADQTPIFSGWVKRVYPESFFISDLDASWTTSDPDYMDRWKPTSGAIGAILALHMCDEVWLYGMTDGPNSRLPGTQYHYYNLNGAIWYHFTWHVEKDLFRRIAHNGDEIDSSDVAKIKGFSTACGETEFHIGDATISSGKVHQISPEGPPSHGKFHGLAFLVFGVAVSVVCCVCVVLCWRKTVGREPLFRALE